MKRLVKVALGAATLATFGNAAAVDMEVNLRANVASSCNTEDAFVADQDLSGQIDGDGGITTTGITDTGALPITTGARISCNIDFTTTTLTMVSLKKGLMNGSVVLPYMIFGNFGSVSDHADPPVLTELTDAGVLNFDSGIGPAGDLLNTATTPDSIPVLKVILNPQPTGTAIAGNYVDTLTISVITIL